MEVCGERLDSCQVGRWARLEDHLCCVKDGVVDLQDAEPGQLEEDFGQFDQKSWVFSKDGAL